MSPDAATVVRTYGRGSFLAFLSPLLAAFMAVRGMNGWERTATRQMQDDAIAMAGRGYRVVSADEYRIAAFGVSWFKVTYARDPGALDPGDGHS